MFNYLFVRHTFLCFVLAVFVNIFCHTVVFTSELLTSEKNESVSKNNIEFKTVESKKEINKIRDLNLPENVSPVAVNVTVHSNNLGDDDFVNSTIASLQSWRFNEGALQRTGYVVLGFMSIVLIFFVVRAVRLRQKRSKSRKYGIITSTASDMEMEPLDKDDDDEEDATLFDAQHKYSLQ